MFVHPWFVENSNWDYVQSVWDRWQSLNTGAFAFLASLLAFNISKFNENRQRERDFVAARAFLPSTLSSLMEYFSSSARVYEHLWNMPDEATQNIEAPRLPSDYREIFSNCIRHAQPDIGAYLSNIVVRLQIHEARMRDAISQANSDGGHRVGKHEIIPYLMRLGELHVLTANLFAFARGEEVFSEKHLNWGNMQSAYRILNLEVDDVFISEQMNLEAFTKRWLERTQDQISETAT